MIVTIDLSAAATDIIAERQRQIESEGWTFTHDDCHQYGELAFAAAAYAVNGANPNAQIDLMCGRRGNWFHGGWTSLHRILWPWEATWWKPKTPREDLVRAGALILAEIERLDRLATKEAAE